MTSLLANWKLILILILTLLLASIAFLYKNSVETVGQLKEANTELSRQVKQAEEDKSRLQTTIEGNAKISAEDNVKQQAIQEQVTQLNKTIAQLKSSNNILKKKANGSNQACQSDGSDVELSDDLRLQLESAYKGSAAGNSPR